MIRASSAPSRTPAMRQNTQLPQGPKAGKRRHRAGPKAPAIEAAPLGRGRVNDGGRRRQGASARTKLRRDHHRRRPARPGAGLVSRPRRPEHPAGRAPADLRRRAVDPRGHQAGLLSQPAFDQSFPHHRNALVQGPRPAKRGWATSRRATSSGRRISTAPRWCWAATSRRRSPTSRASRAGTPRPSASGTARLKRSPAPSCCRSAMRSRCRRRSVKRCSRAPRSAATFSR